MSQPESLLDNARGRLGRYLIRRLLTLLITLTVGVYVAVVVANLGGYVDRIIEADINDALSGMAMGGWLRDETQEDRARIFEETRVQMQQDAGLYQPFVLRCLRWTFSALTFQWANQEVWDAFPFTLLLFGVAVLILLFTSLFMSLALSLRYDSLLDRLMVALSPLSAAPSWIHGILLLVIFAAGLNWLPYGGVYDAEIPENRVLYALMVAKHLVLPVTAVFLSAFFNLVYTWRTYFLIHAEEDYVEVAQAKGLPNRKIERRYILRPTLPFVITNFALLVLGFWQTSIALEVYFDWPGIGRLYMDAVRMGRYSPSMVVSLMTLFAYLLGVSFFLLDIVYLLIDPRVGSASQQAQLSTRSWRGRKLALSEGLYRLTHRQLPRVRLDVYGWLEQVSSALHSMHEDIIRGMPSLREAVRQSLQNIKAALIRFWRGLGDWLDKLRRYPSAITGMLIIALLLIMSIYAVIYVPYDEIVSQWRRTEREDAPRKAMPIWTNFFREKDLPETIVLDSRDGGVFKQSSEYEQGVREVTLSYVFDYPYGGFPQDLVVDFYTSYQEKRPHLTLTWIKPNGRATEISSFSITSETRYLVSLDERLPRRLHSETPLQELFIDPAYSLVMAREGQYELRVSGLMFEPESDLDGHMVIFGQVYGLGGTDAQRRDLWLGLLWGAPAALGVGLGGAVITSLLSMLLAAVGVWYGSWIDSLVQRLAEINLTLPILPIGIMVYFLYTKNIWLILLVIVVFTVFGSPLKTYRAAFLQVKQLPYVEAAQAYGAGNGRIIRSYLMPRILPVLVPQLVAMVPGFVFMEATLAMLGVIDLNLPTWGKILYDAMINGALRGYYYWVLEPLILLLLTGIAFALVGLALDRILNPRLRTL